MSYSITHGDLPLQTSPLLVQWHAPAVPIEAIPIIGGGEDSNKKNRRGPVEFGAEIGDTVAVVITGDGPNGVFVGTLADAENEFIRIVLTAAVGPIPAGTVLTVLTDEIAAFGRVTATT